MTNIFYATIIVTADLKFKLTLRSVPTAADILTLLSPAVSSWPRLLTPRSPYASSMIILAGAFTMNSRNLSVTLSESRAYRCYGRCTYTHERTARKRKERDREENAGGGRKRRRRRRRRQRRGGVVRADAPGASTIIASCLLVRGGRPWPRTTIPKLHSTH